MVCLRAFSDLVYVKPESFNAAKNKNIATEIEKINRLFVKQGSRICTYRSGKMGLN